MQKIILHTIKKLAPYIIGVGILLFILFKTNWLPSPKNWFTVKPVTIDQTDILVTEIKSIAELQTAKLFTELVVDSFEITQSDYAFKAFRDAMLMPFNPYPGMPVGKKLIIISRGKVIAGMDLLNLNKDQMYIAGDSISLRLPSSSILEIITNPSDFEIFIEEGSWSNAAIQAVKQKARMAMEVEATRQNLIGLANTKAIALMEAFLKSLGYNKVTITII